MGFKESMAEMMMGKMTPEQKKEMMDGMMGKFFADMTSDDKQSMMDNMMEKFMGTMSAEEKQGMMQFMMPKMMEGMMGKGGGMMNMMGMMMGKMGGKSAGASGEKAAEGEMPWDMCKKMMATMGKTSELATFATPEVRELFEEWAVQIEEEILSFVQKNQNYNLDQIAANFKLSRSSITYFMTRLAQKGKINLKAEKSR